MTVLHPATQRQITAADPAHSTWVSANAGSGKTRVLIDRVARLLLHGVPPEKVLCLTYTKAAAAEMQNRLFARLGAWAMLPDDRLRGELARLGEAPPEGGAALRAARRLFARAIEAPGGLKIQTIHSFCATLLRRFPLEAGVRQDFTEVDERAQGLLLDEILDGMAEGPEAGLVEALALHRPGDGFETLLAEIVRCRDAFDPDLTAGDWAGRLGAAPGDDPARLLADVFLGGEAELFRDLATALAGGSTSDQRDAAVFAHLVARPPTIESLVSLEHLLLFGPRTKAPFAAKIGKIPTKALRLGAAAPHMPALEALMLRVEAARPRRCALVAAERTHALHRFAGAFLARYESAKEARGWLDFDDLILRTRALLQRPGVADWVLFRLDGGIDHILVDEAQDTSPEQWDVIRLIAEEFSAGESARSGVARTLFVVGDLKQSIYSFQGADPARFEHMARHFGTRLTEVGERLERADLLHSFRSAPDVLRAVDAAFGLPERHAGLGGPPQHWAFHEDKPGRVDLWPAIPADEKPEDGAWYDPVDRKDPADADVRLAELIADEIQRLCHPVSGEMLPVTVDGTTCCRRAVPGDFLVLVQRRSTLFAELIRACKARRLPIAGADRLRLGGELAVKDLAAVMSFVATPEDDLSLAAALRSPLFGWSEDRLFRLAAGRGGRFLWEALRASNEEATLEILRDLLNRADFLRPYDLLERILTRHDGRRRLLARLGPEAEDGIDALLGQAMAYERNEVPSLTGFLTWMQTDDVEVKRQLESGGGVVRVMTVHGAKGLEAPVVILPDTRAAQRPRRGEVLRGEDGLALWRSRAEEAPEAMRRAVAEDQRREAEERMRLLYVAMTRAQSWLIVAGAKDVEKGEGAWYAVVREALEHSGALPVETPSGTGLRLQTGDRWSGAPPCADRAEPRAAAEPLAWSYGQAAPPPASATPLSPSGLGGAKALPAESQGFDEAAAKLRGTQVHRLLEHLPGQPREARAALAAALLGAGEAEQGEAEAASLLAHAERVMDAAELAWIFAPGVLCEVEIAAAPAMLGGRRLLGTVDRLAVFPDRVVAVDFKTNAVVPARPEEVPEGILRQMGAYAAALAEIYPGRRIETVIVWTSVPSAMLLPPRLVEEALGRASLT